MEKEWRDAIRVVRAGALAGMRGQRAGRATAFEFAGLGGTKTWIGVVSMAAGARTGAHRHGRHEVALYVTGGRGRIRWGERLEFAAEIGAGDFIYFAPFAPHEEINLDPAATLDFIVVRSDGERIVEPLDVAAEEAPDFLF